MAESIVLVDQSNLKSCRVCGIYRIRNIVNGKCYYGSSGHIGARLNRHRNDLRRKAHSNPRLQNAWNKYGADAFVFEVVEECAEPERLRCEQVYLDATQCADRQVGYNICLAANGSRHSPETIETLRILAKKRGVSQACRIKQRLSALGRKKTPEELAKLAAKRNTPENRERQRKLATGRRHSPETIEKCRIASGLRKVTELTRRRLSQSGMGHAVSPETRDKLRAAATGRLWSPEQKKKASETQITIRRERKLNAQSAQRRGSHPQLFFGFAVG